MSPAVLQPSTIQKQNIEMMRRRWREVENVENQKPKAAEAEKTKKVRQPLSHVMSPDWSFWRFLIRGAVQAWKFEVAMGSWSRVLWVLYLFEYLLVGLRII